MLTIIKGEIEAIEKEMNDLKNVHHAEMLNRWKDVLKSYKAELKVKKKSLLETKKDLVQLSKDKRDPRIKEWEEKKLNLEQEIHKLNSAIVQQEAVIANHKSFYTASFYKKLPVWVNAPQSDYQPVLVDWYLLQKIEKLLKRSRVELEIIRPPHSKLIIHFFTGYGKGRYELNGLQGAYENFKQIPVAEPAGW